MSKEQKEFLEEQLQWTRDQVLILDEMEVMLKEMKKIAEYVAHNKLSPSEISYSSNQINSLNQEYEELLKSYQPVIH